MFKLHRDILNSNQCPNCHLPFIQKYKYDNGVLKDITCSVAYESNQCPIKIEIRRETGLLEGYLSSWRVACKTSRFSGIFIYHDEILIKTATGVGNFISFQIKGNYLSIDDLSSAEALNDKISLLLAFQ